RQCFDSADLPLALRWVLFAVRPLRCCPSPLQPASMVTESSGAAVTTVIAYLPEGESPYLLTCWLRTLPVDVRVTLLVDEPRRDLESAGGEQRAAIEAVQVIAPGAAFPAEFR